VLFLVNFSQSCTTINIPIEAKKPVTYFKITGFDKDAIKLLANFINYTDGEVSVGYMPIRKPLFSSSKKIVIQQNCSEKYYLEFDSVGESCVLAFQVEVLAAKLQIVLKFNN